MTTPTPKLICFDFDETITCHNLSDALRSEGLRSAKLAEDPTPFHDYLAQHYSNQPLIRYPELLLDTMRNALKTPGVRIAITSTNNYPPIIPIVLEKVGLTEDEIKQIIYIPSNKAPEWWRDFKRRLPGYDDKRRLTSDERWDIKNALIKKAIKAAELPRGFNRSDVMLVDDDQEMTTRAKAEGFSIICANAAYKRDPSEYLKKLREFVGLKKFQEIGPAAQDASSADKQGDRWSSKAAPQPPAPDAGRKR